MVESQFVEWELKQQQTGTPPSTSTQVQTGTPASTSQAGTIDVSGAQMAHKKGARPSTEQKHQEGEARAKRDRGGEKGDKRRQEKGMHPRRPPGGKQPKGASSQKPKPRPPEPPQEPK